MPQNSHRPPLKERDLSLLFCFLINLCLLFKASLKEMNDIILVNIILQANKCCGYLQIALEK